MSGTPARSRELLRAREDRLFLVLTIVVGVAAGLSAVLFSLSIEVTSRYLFGMAPSGLRLFLVPTLASVVAGVLLAKVVPDVRGSGVPQTKAAFLLSGGVIRPRVPIGKFITGVLCVGSGQSMGREGPSVQIGAGLASGVGRWLKLSPQRTRELVPVGAAGALAAAFNTPVAAVLFTLEEIIGDLNASLIGSTVLASVASVVVMRSLLGNEPLFRVPAYQLVHPAELGAYALLGVAGGGLSLLFCKALLGCRAWFLRQPASSRIVQPVAGGVVVGAMLLVTPAVMGVGYEYVDQALNSGLVAGTMLSLCLLKLLATTVSYGSGNAGGIFAPSLYIGAMLGGAVGVAVNTYAPFATGEPGAYALVGMGTLFAGIIRAPMTSVFMIFEITQDYEILVPLMVANLLSYLISRRYQPVAVYDALLRQDNIHLPVGGARPFESLRTARDVMKESPGTLETIPDPHVHPDHALEVVLDRLSQGDGALPVVSRTDARVQLGVITLDSLVARPGLDSRPATGQERAGPPSEGG
jgi:CIC family chloride channel protein